MKNRLAIAVLTAGFSGLVAQMLLLRELLVVFSGNELSIGIVFANWLILEAFGCFFLGRRAENVENRIEIFVGIIILFSLSLPASIYLAREIKNILGVSIGEGMGFLPIIYSSFFVLLPASVLHGALFTFSCRIFSVYSGRDASSVGKIYVYEVAGTIIGGIVWTYLLIQCLHSFQVAAVIGVLNFLACAVLLFPLWKLGRLQKAGVITVCLLLFSGGYSFFAGGADALQNRSIRAQWKGHNVVHYENSLYGNICVVESAGQYTFFKDGIPGIATPVPDIAFVEEFAHLPLLSHPRPEKLLILGGGAGGVIAEVLKHPSLKLVEYAELDPLLLELIRKFPTPLTEHELADDRVRIKHIDGRLFLTGTDKQYDLILTGAAEPSDLQTNRYFTEEFFALAKDRLGAGGILAFNLPGSLTYLNEELKNLNACIFYTLKNVFPHVRAIPGDGRNLFLASVSPEISMLDMPRIADRMNERNLKADTIVPRHIEQKLHPRWADWFSGFVEDGSREINRDFRPVGVFYSISHRSAVFTPYLCGLFRRIGKINLWLIFAFLLVFTVAFLALRPKYGKFSAAELPLCAATTGFAGMIFDLALIFTFQSLYGYVFSWIGLLVTSFMAGSACGAIAMTSALERIRDNLKFFIKIESAIIIFAFGLPFIFLAVHPRLDSAVMFVLVRILFIATLFISGLLIGAQFPLANRIYLENSKNFSSTAGLFYGVDLLGGWLGGIAGGVVLLPVLGLTGACMAVVLLKLSSFVIILTGQYKKQGGA